MRSSNGRRVLKLVSATGKHLLQVFQVMGTLAAKYFDTQPTDSVASKKMVTSNVSANIKTTAAPVINLSLSL